MSLQNLSLQDVPVPYLSPTSYLQNLKIKKTKKKLLDRSKKFLGIKILTMKYVFKIKKIPDRAQGHLARDNLEIKIFKLDSWSPGSSFLLQPNLLSIKRIRVSDFKKNNFVIMKRER